MLKPVMRLVKYAAVAFVLSTVLIALLLKFINPNVTLLMVAKSVVFTKNAPQVQKQWADIDNVSPNIISAVIAAEDNKFFNHFGFDFGEIKAALENSKKGKKLRGASTISQQTAKNVFLWSGRSWFRKGLEVYFTVLVEALWSKDRIMEVYLNIAELGKGIYGVEKASQIYYSKSAKKLTEHEASLLATVLPNPKLRNPSRPGKYMLSYQRRIRSKMKPLSKLKTE